MSVPRLPVPDRMRQLDDDEGEGSEGYESSTGRSYTPRSPWDALSVSPSPSPSSLGASLPIAASEDGARLVPEVETGNVEYKYILKSPSPERFTRLVTQLKWRLLAGSGSALYEIGVSDSGELIGLTRDDMIQSLDTLERMTAQLQATMIVQKEVILPAPSSSSASLEVPSSNDDLQIASDLRKAAALSIRDHGSPLPISLENTVAFVSRAGSSPRPIIRSHPEELLFSQTPSARIDVDRFLNSDLRLQEEDAAPLDSDDDATFAFELDIDKFSSMRTAPASRAGLDTSLEDASRDLNLSRSRTLKQATVPADPAEKAKRRRERRNQNRADRLNALVNSQSASVATHHTRAENRKGESLPGKIVEGNLDARRGGLTGMSPAEGTINDLEVPEANSGDRYIAEVLVLKKFVTEVGHLADALSLSL